MSELYCSSDGYRPLLLPEKGEDLLEGRQYVLTPLARVILKEVFGLAGIPTIVLCTHRRIAATVLLSRTINLETREHKRSRTVLPAQDAAFAVQGAKIRFTLDLARLDQLAEFYDKSHKLPGCDEKQTADQIRRAEEDWFAQSSLPPINRKFRGCTLRWWGKGAEVVLGESFKPYMKRVARKEEKVDLSVFAI